MGRPKIYAEPRVTTAVRLPVSMLLDLRRAAVEREVSVKLLVTRALADYLGRLPDGAEGVSARAVSGAGRDEVGS